MGWLPLTKWYLTCQRGEDIPTDCREATAMKITTIGIDLAKNVFQVYGVDEHGKVLLKKQLKRDQMLFFLPTSPLPFLAWKPVAAHTIGPTSCKGWGIPSS